MLLFLLSLLLRLLQQRVHLRHVDAHELRPKLRCGAQRQYLCFCTSKANKLSTCGSFRAHTSATYWFPMKLAAP